MCMTMSSGAPMNSAYKRRSHGSLTESAEGPRCPFVLYVITECLRGVFVKPRVSSCGVLRLRPLQISCPSVRDVLRPGCVSSCRDTFRDRPRYTWWTLAVGGQGRLRTSVLRRSALLMARYHELSQCAAEPRSSTEAAVGQQRRPNEPCL